LWIAEKRKGAQKRADRNNIQAFKAAEEKFIAVPYNQNCQYCQHCQRIQIALGSMRLSILAFFGNFGIYRNFLKPAE
jgi:hypothetical protein